MTHTGFTATVSKAGVPLTAFQAEFLEGFAAYNVGWREWHNPYTTAMSRRQAAAWAKGWTEARKRHLAIGNWASAVLLLSITGMGCLGALFFA